MKRAYLIAGGTLGGLGAVLAITPPQLSSNEAALGGVEMTPVADTTATQAPASSATTSTTEPSPSQSATTKSNSKSTTATTSKNSTASQGTTSSQSTTTSATTSPAATSEPTPAATKSATSGKAQSGTFTGDPYTMRYGTVQVKITISGGKITDAVAVQAPSGRDQRYTDMAVPVMRQKTLAAQSSNITGVSGASYTAYAWYISLQSALSKAGWM